MRDIKFRGMTIEGYFVYGLLSKPNYGKYFGKTFISNGAGSPLAFEIRPETVGQYTGFKDKNGKEIYEGDIVKCVPGKEIYREVIWENGKYIFYNGEFGFPIMVSVTSHPETEVVGNIFQDTELIK